MRYLGSEQRLFNLRLWVFAGLPRPAVQLHVFSQQVCWNFQKDDAPLSSRSYSTERVWQSCFISEGMPRSFHSAANVLRIICCIIFDGFFGLCSAIQMWRIQHEEGSTEIPEMTDAEWVGWRAISRGWNGTVWVKSVDLLLLFCISLLLETLQCHGFSLLLGQKLGLQKMIAVRWLLTIYTRFCWRAFSEGETSMQISYYLTFCSFCRLNHEVLLYRMVFESTETAPFTTLLIKAHNRNSICRQTLSASF